jgi:hypothetical protein
MYAARSGTYLSMPLTYMIACETKNEATCARSRDPGNARSGTTRALRGRQRSPRADRAHAPALASPALNAASARSLCSLAVAIFASCSSEKPASSSVSTRGVGVGVDIVVDKGQGVCERQVQAIGARLRHRALPPYPGPPTLATAAADVPHAYTRIHS